MDMKKLLFLILLIALPAASFAENIEDPKNVDLPQMKETTSHESKGSGESGWEKCERNTNLAGMTSLLGAVINLFCTGAAAIDRAIETAPKEDSHEDFETKLRFAFYGAVGRCREAIKKEDFKFGAEKDFSDMVKADANDRPFSIKCRVTEESKDNKKFSIPFLLTVKC